MWPPACCQHLLLLHQNHLNSIYFVQIPAGLPMWRAWTEPTITTVVVCTSVLLSTDSGREWLAAHLPFSLVQSLPAGFVAAFSVVVGCCLALMTVCPWPSRSVRARTLAWLASESDVHGKPLERGVVGLVNLGNSCYQNATLQALAAEPGLTAYFISGEYEVHRA